VATEAAVPASTSAGICFGPYIGRQRTRPQHHVVTMHPNRSCEGGGDILRAVPIFNANLLKKII
jgi:hypothetical protein